MELELRQRGPSADAQSLAYLRQASDFLGAAESATSSARPLLLYYSLLNLAKVRIRQNKSALDLRRAVHGVSEDKGNAHARRFTLSSQVIRIHHAKPNAISILLELSSALGAPIIGGATFRVDDLLAQVPAIHRSFMHATGSAQRIYSVSRAQFFHDSATNEYWVSIDVRDIPPDASAGCKLERRINFRKAFRFVEATGQSRSFESVAIVANDAHTAVRRLAELCKQAGMLSILTAEGYRFYIGDFAPKERVHQILATYLAAFYFGSVARYRPVDLEKVLAGKYGWTAEEFFSTQERQAVYLMANEILGRELVRPWALGQDRFRL